MPQYRVVTDPDDPAVAPFRSIKERDLVGREGLFIAEGETVLRAFVRDAPGRVVSLLIDPRRQEKLAGMLAGLPEETPVHLADQVVLDAIAGFHLHRGVLAVGRKPEPVAARDLLSGLPSRAVALVLCGIANHDNMGGIYRNAAAFGADAVILDHECCDPFYRKAIRVSVGAALTVPFARAAPETDLPQLLQDQGFEVLALSPAGKTLLSELRPAARVAALFGAEGPGLPAKLLAQAHTVRIPMAGNFDSLNVATTSGIVLHHLACGCSIS